MNFNHNLRKGFFYTFSQKPNQERKRLREVLYFRKDPGKHIDYVLCYEELEDEKSEQENKDTRKIFEKNLSKQGIHIEREHKKDSVNRKTHFTKLNVSWDSLCKTAELLYLPKRIKMNKDGIDMTSCCDYTQTCCYPSHAIIEDEEDYFTAEFDYSTLGMFEIKEDDKEHFWTNAERSLIAYEILSRTKFTKVKDGCQKYGINRLISKAVYKAAYPLHEGNYETSSEDPNPFEGYDKDRARLYETWARPGRWWCYQPLDLVRKYFGEKIAIYFSWLGFYTVFLIPASVMGIGVFIYGGLTLPTNGPSEEICGPMANTTMCPSCSGICSYFLLKKACTYSKITYLFDNLGTLVFTAFMSIWATMFQELWGRKEKTLQYDWDVADYELEERIRPEFEFKVNKTKTNPITLEEEKYLPWYSKFPRLMTSFGIVFLMIFLVMAAIAAVVIYRMAIILVFFKVGFIDRNETYARLLTSMTASCLNFLAIAVLNFFYERLAVKLTEFETPRTWTEFEDSLTIKMFLFQFINYYGSIIYIAFFKGKFQSVPNEDQSKLLNKYEAETCDASGCMIDLFIQLGVIMTLKQTINNVKEIGVPLFKRCWSQKRSIKKESEENLYMRWEQDKDLGAMPETGLFEEYLEMVIQFGFVTIFVAAFPLAPFFALLNNIIEIRLDAYKFTCLWRRSYLLKAKDIGIWNSLLQTITFISIISNALILGFTSDFVPKFVWWFNEGDKEYGLYGYMNNSLGYFNINDFTDDTRPNDTTNQPADNICRYRGYYNGPDHAEPYAHSTLYWQVLAARLAFVIAFEHTVFFLTWMVKVLIPDVPANVKRLMLYERELTKKLRYDAKFEDTDEPQNDDYNY